MFLKLIRKVRKVVMRASKVRLGIYVASRVNKRKEIYYLHYPNDLTDLKRKLLPGDVLLVEGETGVSDWIKVFSSHTWSHCALFVGDQSRIASTKPKEHVDSRPNLVEAIMGRGVILGNFAKYEDCNLRICRPRYLTRKERESVIQFALSKVGFPYDLENVLQFMSLPFDESLPPTEDIGDSSNAKYTCSSLIAAAFRQVGCEVLGYYDKETKRIAPYHFSQIQPKDFDLSPNFDIIKIQPAAYRKTISLFSGLFPRKKSA